MATFTDASRVVLLRVDRITPESYMNMPGHRELGDRLVAAAGLRTDDVALAERVAPGTWVLTVHERNASGHLFVRDGEVAQHTVTVELAGT